jgi:anthranilate synthase component 1
MDCTSLEEFRLLANERRIVPVVGQVLADLTTPVAGLLRLAKDGEPVVLLESVEQGERWSRWSFLGRRPLAQLSARGNVVEVTGDLGVEVPLESGLLTALRVLFAEHSTKPISGLPPLCTGLVGFLGYDVVREIEHLPDTPVDDRNLPDAELWLVGEMAAYDHWKQRVHLVVNTLLAADASMAEVDAAYNRACERLNQLALDGAQPLDEPLINPPAKSIPPADVTRRSISSQYQDAVKAAKEFIAAGDVFQVVVSQRFDLELKADPIDLYRALRQINPSPYMFFFRTSQLTLVGASPEALVRVDGDVVVARPIAGTRRRGVSEAEDQVAAHDLLADPKERAEHVMLVDLARNDVARVSVPGSRSVPEFMSVEYFSHVIHMTSEVQGTLRPNIDLVDVLRSTFPAGTLSGAPKVRAMEIIDELEPLKRGPYAGVVGWFGFQREMDAAIAIRTVVVTPDGMAFVQAGAGLVADSDPATEDVECQSKAAAVLTAISAARAMRSGFGGAS